MKSLQEQGLTIIWKGKNIYCPSLSMLLPVAEAFLDHQRMMLEPKKQQGYQHIYIFVQNYNLLKAFVFEASWHFDSGVSLEWISSKIGLDKV
jgi:hypothetical protein